MTGYICNNCGNIQNSYGNSNSGCAPTFWIICLVFTIFISLFAAVTWVVVGFEILFLILTSNSKRQNVCFKCRAKDCVIPLDTPRGQQVYNEFYPQKAIEKQIIEENEPNKETALEDKTETVIKEDDNHNWMLKDTLAILCLFLVLIGYIIFNSIQDNKQSNQPPAAVQKNEQEQIKEVENIEAQCKAEAKDVHKIIFNIQTPNAEAKINNYYSKCAKYEEEDKHNFLERYYNLKASDYKERNNFDQAIIYYKKAIGERELGKDHTSKSGINMIDVYNGYIAECYYNTWRMEEAAKYYELAIAHGYAVLPFSEKLGDCYYNLGLYDKANLYYTKTIEKVQEYRAELIRRGDYTTEKREELERLEEKCNSIIDGTFDQ